MKDADALAEARDIIQDGWCKGALHKDAEGASVEAFNASRETSCLLGAIALVAENDIQANRLQKATIKGIRHVLNDNGRTSGFVGASIPSFNDDSKTTHEDVILALKHAETIITEK